MKVIVLLGLNFQTSLVMWLTFAIVAENKQFGRCIYSMYFRDNLVINYANQLSIILYPEQERKDTDKVDMYGR